LVILDEAVKDTGEIAAIVTLFIAGLEITPIVFEIRCSVIVLKILGLFAVA
jgi:hypothetical protein